MITTPRGIEALDARLEEVRGQQAEVWAAFGRDFDTKAELVSYLVDLAFSLTSEQTAQMEQQGGLPASKLAGAQWALFSPIELLADELGFLTRGGERRLAKSSFLFDAGGHVSFTWAQGDTQHRLGINWLPYSRCNAETQHPFRQACDEWRQRREWLIRQHYADFRQAADCCRLLFELALTLTPLQLGFLADRRGLPVARLHPEQRTLLEIAFRLYPGRPVTDLEGCAATGGRDGRCAAEGSGGAPRSGRRRQGASAATPEGRVHFEPEGQFWIELRRDTETIHYGMGWLPYSWS
jgi:hypothetical protein